MLDRDVLDIIKDVANERGISPTILEKAWKNQYRQVATAMRSSVKNDPDTFKVVYLRMFGKFVPKTATIEKMRDAVKS